MLRRLAGLGLLLVAAVPSTAAAQGPDLGQVVEYTFAQPLENARGVTSLNDLRGRPTLVEFWVPDCSVCYSMSIPSALEMQEAYGNDLAVIFVDYSGRSRDEMLATAAKHGWLGGSAMWTKELPFDLGFWKEGMPLRGDHQKLPAVALIGANGELLLKGGYSDLRNGDRLTDAVDAEVARRQAVVDDAPKAVARTWKSFSNGRAGRALTMLEQQIERPSRKDPEESVAQARRVLSAYQKRIDEWIRACDTLIDAGHYAEAANRLNELVDALKGRTVLTDQCEEMLARLTSDEYAAEVQAEQELLKLEKKLHADGPSRATAKRLEAFAERNPSLKAATRARELAAFAAIADG